MKPELQIAITNVSEVLRTKRYGLNGWVSFRDPEKVLVRTEDLQALLEAAKPKQGRTDSQVLMERHGIPAFVVPPEDFLEQLHNRAVAELRGVVTSTALDRRAQQTALSELEALAGSGDVR